MELVPATALLPKEVERSDAGNAAGSSSSGHKSFASMVHHVEQELHEVYVESEKHVGDQNVLEAGINAAEQITGIDIDGDGDVGLPGQSKKMLTLAEVLAAATAAERSNLFDEARITGEQDQQLRNKWWLTNTLMYRAVELRNGKDSWEAKAVRWLQSRCVQITLIVLLLLDVLIVFAELFLETEHPSCKTMRKHSYSCCPTEGVAAAGAAAHRMPSADGHAISAHEDTELFGFLHVPHAPTHGCDAPAVPYLVEAGGSQIGCDMAEWAHTTHEIFSMLSLVTPQTITPCGPAALHSPNASCAWSLRSLLLAVAARGRCSLRRCLRYSLLPACSLL